MNTERLYEILEKLQAEVSRTGVLEKLGQLVSHISRQVDDPSNAAHQQKFAIIRKMLTESLRDSWFTELTPLEAETLKSIGLESLVNGSVVGLINAMVRDIGMLPAVVRDDLSAQVDRIRGRFELALSTLENLQNMGFAAEPLEVGTGELAFRIPRAVIDNRLESFLADGEFFKRFAEAMGEIVHGEKRPAQLRAISSSAFSLFLNIDPQVVAFIVLAIERVMNGYKTLLEIRVLHEKLKERDVPEDDLKPLNENISKRMEEIFRQALDGAIADTETKAKKERLNELKNLGSTLLRQLVDKLEGGYEVDARVGHDEPDESNAESAETAQSRKIDKFVRRSIKAIRRAIIEAKKLDLIENRPADSNDDQDLDGDEAVDPDTDNEI